MTLRIYKLRTHFKLPYANTYNNVQGLSRSEKIITMFDGNTPYVDSYFIGTALTRAMDLKNVHVFEHSEEELMSLKRSRVKLYFNHKVQGYKQIDNKTGRHYNKYIDAEWFKVQHRS